MAFNEEQFLQQRIQGWTRLSMLCEKAARTFRDLSGAEIVEYVRLYRQASGDLAYMSSHSTNRDVVVYLNALVSRAYGQLYRSRVAKFGTVVQQGLWLAADTFRRRIWFFVLSAAIFFGAAFYAAGMMTIRPETKGYFISPEMEPLFDGWKEGKFDGRSADEGLMMTGFYASNNPRVGIITIGVAAGTVGIGSTILIWQNGVMLGSLGKEMNDVGQLGFLLSSVAPHGVSEIGGIFVAGAAGYVLAFGILAPGRRRWIDSLKYAGKDGFVLAVLALILIAAAAPIEGFFSFNPAVPQIAKTIFALIALTGWTAFFGLYGRNKTAADMGLE